MNFDNYLKSQKLLSVLSTLNFAAPRPIQQLVIPATKRGDNLLVKAQTGSGKTLAFLLPLLEKLEYNEGSDAGAKALILAPTRELAGQIGTVCESLDFHSFAVIVGGIEYAKQIEALQSKPEIIIATPGRLIDLLEQGVAQLEALQYFILDEVDQMLDLGFCEPIIRLAKLRSSTAQTLCFSATIPDSVTLLVEEIAREVKQLSVENEAMSVENIEQAGYYVSLEMMDRLLIHLLRTEAPQKGIIFTRSRKMADRLVSLLEENKIKSEAMHSDKKQAAREYILGRFRSGETPIIVATDVIARGIDVEKVTHVFNFGLPQAAEQYIHRIGRTGRAGHSGRAISLFTPAEKPMLDQICRLMKRHIPIDSSHPYMTPDVSRAVSR